MSQVDITTAIGWQFLSKGTPELQQSIDAPGIDALLERMMTMPEFSKTLPS